MGDQPAEVYWKRRLGVIVAIVVLALLAWWLISSLGGGDDTPTTPGSTVSPGTTTSPDVTTSPGTTTSPGATAAADPSRACAATDFTLTATAPASVAATTAPSFTVTVTSVASTPCIVDPTVNSKISIRSGNDQWFDSSICTGLNVFNAEQFMLDTGATHQLTASWNYGRDQAGCSTDLQAAKAGTYKVTATVAGSSAEEQTFTVTG